MCAKYKLFFKRHVLYDIMLKEDIFSGLTKNYKIIKIIINTVLQCNMDAFIFCHCFLLYNVTNIVAVNVFLIPQIYGKNSCFNYLVFCRFGWRTVKWGGGWWHLHAGGLHKRSRRIVDAAGCLSLNSVSSGGSAPQRPEPICQGWKRSAVLLKEELHKEIHNLDITCIAIITKQVYYGYRVLQPDVCSFKHRAYLPW